VAEDAGFTWTGALDRARLDTFADPFGNLTIRERALLEEARERHKLGDAQTAGALRDRLLASLPPMKAGQLRAYWVEWVEEAR